MTTTSPMLADLAAERAVLGTVLAGAAPLAVLDGLSAAAFSDPRHQAIRSAMAAVREDGAEGVDVVLVNGELARAGTIVQAGGPAYLADLATAEAAAESLPAYLRIVADRAEARQRFARLRAEAAELLDPSRPLLDESAARRSSVADLWGPLAARSAEAFSVAPAPLRWLLTGTVDGRPDSGVLALARVALLIAPGAAGKSWALILLALSVATGRDWFGFQVATPGKVLLVLAEEDRGEVDHRLYFAGLAMGLTRQEIDVALERIFVLPAAGRNVALTAEQPAPVPPHRLRDPAVGLPVTGVYWELLDLLERDGPWSAVLLDPLARFAGPEVEVDNSQATKFIQSLERLVSLPGTPSVLCAHHTSKAARRGPSQAGHDAAAAAGSRGASGLTDGARWVAALESLPRVEGAPSLVRLSVVKSNNAGMPPDTFLVRDPDFRGALRTATQAEYSSHSEAAQEVADAPARRRREAKAATLLEEVVSAIAQSREPIGAKALRDRVGGAKAAVDQALAAAFGSGRIVQKFSGARCEGWVLAGKSDGDSGGLRGGLVPRTGGGRDSLPLGESQSPSPAVPRGVEQTAESRSPSPEVANDEAWVRQLLQTEVA